MLEVHLTQKELLDCEKAARFRSMFARASGVTNQRKDESSTDQETDLVGIKGELAVAKAYQAEFSVSDYGIDSGIDMFLDDVGIDVKTTKHLTGKLLFKSVESFKAPVAVLCIQIDENTMGIAGWVNRLDFSDKCKPFNDTRSVCLTQDQLNTPESLWLNIAKRRLSNG
jgi:hypothetical protein